MADDRLYVLGQTLLDEAASLLLAAGREVPDRQYVANGPPPDVAWDCRQLTVALVRLFSGTPGLERTGRVAGGFGPCATIWSAEYLIELVRCVAGLDDQGDSPDATVIDAEAATLLTDLYVLQQGLADAAAAGELGARCDDVAIGNVTLVGPEGGMAAVRVPIQVQL